ncbi:MAG TPA: hypothetical protein VNN08_21970 [Thermoanaerobaculia bacterium]|nr:hypothetical protein [Thermoanaerobaculia bacterium]
MRFISNVGRSVLCLLALLFPVVAFAQPHVPPGLDGRFAELARQVPGFGGYFFDDNGDLNVYLTDLIREPAARAAVADVARNRPGRSQQPWVGPAAIIIRHGDFDFLQLDGWRGRLSAAPAIAGVQVLDADEATNRLFIGVTEAAAIPSVLAQVDALGVPRTAVVVDVVPAASLTTSLRDFYRPLIGGLQIDLTIAGTPSQCTLGVNVWYVNVSQGIPPGTAGFYTAAHCSTTRFGTDGTVYSQGGSRIGYERYDPPAFTNAQNTRCPAGYTCRWSDVTFAQYDAGYNRHQGALAQTVSRAYGNFQTGSIVINPYAPEFILYQTTLPVAGQYLDKVGRTTGWTSGQVSRTCADYFIGGNYLLCQDQVEAFADSGDSGSPVFQVTGSSTGAFSGIVWAKTGAGGFIMSNLNEIAADMGNAVTYTP